MQSKLRGTILWLTGWSMPDAVFERLRQLLPDFHHLSVDYSAADSSEDILQLTETAARNALSANARPLLIGGWSLGALLALKLAITELADGLILFSATAKFTRPKGQENLGWPDAYIRQMINGLGKDRNATEIKFRQMVFSEEESVAERAILPSMGGRGWTTSALLAGLEILRSSDYLGQLKEINCSVLLLHGDKDKICPHEAAEEILKLLPRGKLLTIPESGHAPFLAREAYVAESLRSWWHDQQKNSY
ncbi:alpha/beta fold hydrolase [Paenibacillus sp. NPDC058071]|uniref:alpha/beta fold hydrolase n=1 Tax=Paenibacillus sp. NPDC058071 TaxID=3346326 RepID=UPI0036DB8B28